ncbi:MAG: hypothetical protein AAF267_04635 [Deinococcota bacterium]
MFEHLFTKSRFHTAIFLITVVFSLYCTFLDKAKTGHLLLGVGTLDYAIYKFSNAEVNTLEVFFKDGVPLPKIPSKEAFRFYFEIFLILAVLFSMAAQIGLMESEKELLLRRLARYQSQ